MTRQDIFEKVEGIFQDLLDKPDFILNEDISQSNLQEWESLFHITLIATIEDDFGITFSSDEIDCSKKVSTLIDSIMKELDKK